MEPYIHTAIHGIMEDLTHCRDTKSMILSICRVPRTIVTIEHLIEKYHKLNNWPIPEQGRVHYDIVNFHEDGTLTYDMRLETYWIKNIEQDLTDYMSELDIGGYVCFRNGGWEFNEERYEGED